MNGARKQHQHNPARREHKDLIPGEAANRTEPGLGRQIEDAALDCARHQRLDQCGQPRSATDGGGEQDKGRFAVACAPHCKGAPAGGTPSRSKGQSEGVKGFDCDRSLCRLRRFNHGRVDWFDPANRADLARARASEHLGTAIIRRLLAGFGFA